jgi:hypothetical protein
VTSPKQQNAETNEETAPTPSQQERKPPHIPHQDTPPPATELPAHDPHHPTATGLTKRHCTQYTSGEFDEYCRNHNIRRSMGRTGVCWDNAVAESFFATYKKELIHTRPWPTIDQLKTATFSWIETYYNRARRHSTLNYLTPLEYELGYRDIHELAA